MAEKRDHSSTRQAPLPQRPTCGNTDRYQDLGIPRYLRARRVRIGQQMIKKDNNPFVDRIVRVFESEIFTHQSVVNMVWDEGSGSLLVRLEPPDDVHFETLREVAVDKLRLEALVSPFNATARQWVVNGRRNIFFKIAPEKQAA